MSKITYWDAFAQNTAESTREYEETSVSMNVSVPDQWGNRTEALLMRMFIDEETGLVTTDVEKFERWIGTVSK